MMGRRVASRWCRVRRRIVALWRVQGRDWRRLVMVGGRRRQREGDGPTGRAGG